MRTKTLVLAAIAVTSLGIGGCDFANPPSSVSSSNPPEFCQAYPVACVGAVVLIGGGLALAASHHDNGAPPVAVSDARLKTDIRPFVTLPTGLELVTFRFRGDDRRFVGVVAQKLLEDPRFASAVTQLPSGYLGVDYGVLGFGAANLSLMHSAGERSLRRAAEGGGD